MFQTAPGYFIPFPEKVREKYEMADEAVFANVSYEKLKPLVEDFYHKLAEPLFLVLEIPLSQTEEEEMCGGEGLHFKVMYLDRLKCSEVEDILREYGDILLDDGMSQFAIASHRTKDEIYVQRYQVVTIYSQNPEQYAPFLERYGLSRCKELLTAWSTFSDEHYGECSLVKYRGKTSYDVAEELEKRGLYMAKVVDR